MNKVGSSFKSLGMFFLVLVLLFLLFKMFSGSREGFCADTCSSSTLDQTKCGDSSSKCKYSWQRGYIWAW